MVYYIVKIIDNTKKIVFISTTVILICMLFSGCAAKDEANIAEAKQQKENTSIEIPVEREQKIEKEIMEEDKGILYREVQDIKLSSGQCVVTEGISDSPFLMPILQNPTRNSVTVQWFTEGEGSDNKVFLFENGEDESADLKPIREIKATTIKLSRLRGGKTSKNCNDPKIKSEIYKHIAVVDELPEYHGYVSERIKYCISSNGEKSSIYTLAALPAEGTPLKILMTSDLQIKDMCAANFQKVFEEIGAVDAVLCDGDLVDVTDRQYDWFYADNAFWRVMTGTAKDDVEGTTYFGAPILQEAPLFTAIGNHDVMGVYDEVTDLSVQFNNPSTIEHARELLNTADIAGISEEDFIRDHSFNTISYEEMFELPKERSNTEKYYDIKFGDLGLIALDVSRVWKLPNVGVMGKYSELPNANTFGYGDFIFEPVSKDSKQIKYYEEALKSEEFIASKYKMVMFHHEAHSLGGNAVPAFTDPVEGITTDNVTGAPMKTYNYPKKADYINSVIEPLAETANVDVMFNAHSHLWNRFKTAGGMNVIETSNVGNSYGGFLGDGRRTSIPTALNSSDERHGVAGAYNAEYYPTSGDPAGLEPIAPNVTELPEEKPYLASNTITAFSILDTDKGTIDSYFYDTKNPEGGVILFDSFEISRNND